MQVEVRDNNVEQAMRTLKRKLNREGLFRKIRERQAYVKPSEARKRRHAAAVRRSAKADRKRAEADR